MAVRVQDFPKKSFCQSSIQPMPHFPSTTTVWWNFQEQQFPQLLSKSLSLKVGSSPQACQEGKHAGHQPQGQDLSSTQLTDQPHQEVAAVGGNNSQDQCISSDTVQDESYRKHVEGQMKPVLFLANPSFGINSPQVDINPSMLQAHIPYAFGDPYVNGLYTAYGPQAIVQPQVIGIAPAQVPLPIELAEDGPIYVNAKQYNGILRRRQIRAKLEAQNKLLKNRKPYLHESRHRHALNRVRGSGGRFLSTKKPPPNPTPANFDLDSDSINQKETGKGEASPASSSSIMRVANNDFIFEQPEHMFSNISYHMGRSRGLMCNGPPEHMFSNISYHMGRSRGHMCNGPQRLRLCGEKWE